MRKLLALSISALLVFAACGGDDDDDDDSASNASEPAAEDDESGDEFLDDEAYTDVLMQSFVDSEEGGFSAPEDEAQCTAERIVAEIGAERMQEAGITEEVLAAAGTPPSDLTEAEAGEVADAMIECIDLADGLAESFGEEFMAEDRECVANAMIDAGILRPVLVIDIMGGDDAAPPPELAGAMADVTLECVDFGALLVTQFEAGGVEITPEQAACLSDAFAGSAIARAAVIAGILGADDPATGEQEAAMFELVTSCVPAEQLSGGGDSPVPD
ncbi:MAG: hypothetical protein SGJ13_02725 [Actinomycetota bacterium]|nr:hypothetical protein [Actinomycetota bacterium]